MARQMLNRFSFLLVYAKLLFMLVPSHSKMLFISSDGSSSNSCLSANESCETLTRVFELSESGDVIQIISTGNLLELCSSLPITKDLVIEGVMGTPAISCTSQIGVIFSVQFGGRIAVRNVRITGGVILARDGSLTVEECTFDGTAAVYGMSLSTMVFARNSSSRFVYGKEWAQFVNPNNTGSDECSYANITVINSVWTKRTFSSFEETYLDILSQEGIQMICHRVNVKVENSILSDRIVRIQAFTQLFAKFINSQFEGLEQGRKRFQGIRITAFPVESQRDVLIENCHFRNMFFAGRMFEIMAQYENLPAAVYINELLYEEYGIQVDNNETDTTDILDQITRYSDRDHHVRIVNTTFENNSRAVSVMGEKYKYSLGIFESRFYNNKVLTQGGAIHIKTASYVDIYQCEFVNNTVGAIIDPAEEEKNLRLNLYVIFNITFTGSSASADRIQIWYDVFHPSFGVESGIAAIELIGEGGAIYIRQAYCKINQSTFENNVAFKYGGSIYAFQKSQLAIYESTFVDKVSGNHRQFDGTIITSYGSVVIKSSKFSVAHGRDDSVSAIHHFSDNDNPTAWVSNISVYCPENTHLSLFNSSGVIFAIPDKNPDFLSYSKLRYACINCNHGDYSLRAGHMDVPDVSTITDTVDNRVVLDPQDLMRSVQVTKVTCNACPYGGICNGPITAKPNFWGIPNRDKSEVSFHRCPASYCCSSQSCETYNKCSDNREGKLCSRCISGYSEALFTAKCIEDSKCTDYWALFLLSFMGLGYAAFLIFQKDLKDFMLGAPLGKNSLTKQVKQWKNPSKETEQDDKKELDWDAPESPEDKDEGGIFLILLFYYFQDASIVHIETTYVDSDSAVVNSVKTVIGGIFKFRLDVLHLASSLCPITGLNPADKIVFKMIFIPLLLILLITIYSVSLCMESKKRSSRFWDFLARRAALAIVFAILFSYQKLASSLFTLIHCVNMDDSSVLFIDAEIECYTPGQAIVALALIFSICPFSIYIALSPALLKKGYISLPEFYVGCIMPLPMVVYWVIKHNVKKNSKVQPRDDAVAVYKLLQGPYREFELPGILRYTCWSGILLFRRLCLILAATFIHDVIIRLSVMLAICQLALLYHVLVKPCKERRGNVAGTLSSSSLLTVCSVNFLRAAYESAEYDPQGANFTVMQVFDQVENSLLLWIPLAGITVILIVLIGRLVVRYVNKKKQQAVVSPSDTALTETESDATKPKSALCDVSL